MTNFYVDFGGETGIRTLGWITPSTVFKTAALDRSATSPWHSVLKINKKKNHFKNICCYYSCRHNSDRLDSGN